MTAFKNDLRTVLCLPRQRKTLVAGRSAQLVRLAAVYFHYLETTGTDCYRWVGEDLLRCDAETVHHNHA